MRRFDGLRLAAEIDRQIRTREEVAVRSGVSVKTIGRWCRGENEPRRLLVHRVAQELGVPAESFYSDPEEAVA